MADHSSVANRRNDLYDGPRAREGDPLAELARLIGQNDPFAERERRPAAFAPIADARPDESPRPATGATSYGEDYADYADQQTPPSDEYEHAPSRGRRIALLVLVLAALGSAGAFGYRFFGTRASAPPPVIQASPEPVKVTPPKSEPQVGKLSYERVGAPGQNEQVISREERPLDVKDLLRATGVENIPPPPARSGAIGSLAAGSPPSSQSSAAVQPQMLLIEPKKVRTVPIRPDQPDAGVRAQALAPAEASSGRPADTATASANRSPDFRSTPAVERNVARAPTAKPAANAPLQLGGNLPIGVNASQKMAAAPHQAPKAPSAPPSAAPLSGYHVQVTSQRTEAEAQGAFRNLQAKYPGLLGNRQAVVRRADLGQRGVFYRAMIGPFASREQANQFCNSLKSAGGDCLVQAN